MSRLLVLISEDLLTTLAAGHAVLLLLSQFGRGQLLGFLVALDLVAHGIELLFVVVLLGQSGAAALSLNPIKFVSKL